MTGHLLASLTWDPGFRGILVVVVGVTVLMGSCFLLLSTNSGVRLGFLLALTGVFGWFSVMGVIWSMYGIGYKGPAPTWRVVDTVRGDPSQSAVDVADSLPLPKDLPDPVQLRNGSRALTEAYPKNKKDPTIGDIIDVDQAEAKKIDKGLGPWKLMATSNKYTGETQSIVSSSLGPTGQNIFPDGASDYVVLDSFLTGGKKGLNGDTSILHRIEYKFTSPFDLNHAPFRAAVQLQAVIPQTAKAGQAPPAPVRDPKAPIYTIILERNHGALRLPSICFTIVSMTVFAILANMLHRRDKLAAAQRAAAAAGAS